MRVETRTIMRLRDALLLSGRRPSLVESSAYETLARMDLLNPQERAAVTRVDPLAEVMFLMMSADGRITEEERDVMRGAVRGLTNDVLHAGTINVMIETYAKRLAAEGRDNRLWCISEELADTPAEAEAAFTLAAAVALADRSLADEEEALIHQLTQWFRLTPERAQQLLDQLDGERQLTLER
jgi:tellurite resistance protein